MDFRSGCRPVIGGVFARPADRWPGFRDSAFWRSYPYFLPCIIVACISISAFVLASIGLKEVSGEGLSAKGMANGMQTLPRHPRLQSKDPEPAPTDIEKTPPTEQDKASTCVDVAEVPRLDCTTGQAVEPVASQVLPVVPNDANVSAVAEDEGPVGLRSILVPRVLYPILNYGFLALIDQSVTVLVPLMYSTSIDIGGLGFDPFTIGIIQGVGGFVGGIIQIFTFPYMHRKLGSKKLYICSYSMYFVIFALFPLNSFVTKRAGEAAAATWALVIVQYVVYVASYMTWGKPLRLCPYLKLDGLLTTPRCRLHLHLH